MLISSAIDFLLKVLSKTFDNFSAIENLSIGETLFVTGFIVIDLIPTSVPTRSLVLVLCDHCIVSSENEDDFVKSQKALYYQIKVSLYTL